MKRSAMPARHTSLRRGSGLSRTQPIRRSKIASKRAGDIPAPVRKAVAARSGGLCECGCGRRAQHMHHRKLRSQGGKHELINLLNLSLECHERAHRERDRSRALGLIVPPWADPADVPVITAERAA